MTKIRGISYLKYHGKYKCILCGENGYLEEWQSYLTSRYTVFSVKHSKKHITTKRCWLNTIDVLIAGQIK